MDVNIHRQTGSEHDTVCVFSTIQKDSSSNVDNQQQTRDECGTSVLQSNVSTNSSDDVGLYDRKRIHTGMGVGSQLCFDRHCNAVPRTQCNYYSSRRIRSELCVDRLCINSTHAEHESNHISIIRRLFTPRDYSSSVGHKLDPLTFSPRSRVFSNCSQRFVTSSNECGDIDTTGKLSTILQDLRRSREVIPTTANRDKLRMQSDDTGCEGRPRKGDKRDKLCMQSNDTRDVERSRNNEQRDDAIVFPTAVGGYYGYTY